MAEPTKQVIDCTPGLPEDQRVREMPVSQEDKNRRPEEERAAARSAQQIQRQHRNALLRESDWTQLDDSPVNKATWRTYRQALRDHPLDGSDLPNPPA